MNRVITNDNYILGHSDSELARLIRQSDFWGEHTREFLQQAGLKPGMRVLDLGSGVGDVTFLASALVGPNGAVLGVDRAPEAVARATERATDMDIGNVRFIQADIDTVEPEGTFDALIGRLVLLYLPDPAATLRRLIGYLKPGGIVAFQDFDMHAAVSEPPAPTFDQGIRWIVEAFARSKIPTRMGLHLHRLYQSAGLPAPQTVLASRVEGTPDSPMYEYFAQVVRTLAPRIEQLELASAEQIQIDTLAARVREEVLSQQGVITPPSLIGAWTYI